MPVNKAGRQEVNGTLYPQSPILESHLVERRTGSHDAHIAVHAKGRGEYPRHITPEHRFGSHRPGHTAEEKQRDRHEDIEQHSVFTAVDEGRHGYAHEYAGEDIRKHKVEKGDIIAQLQQRKPIADTRIHIDSHQEKDRQVEKYLPHDLTNGTVKRSGSRQTDAIVMFAIQAHGCADRKKEKLLYDEHEDSRNEETRHTALRIEHGHIRVGDRIPENFLLTIRATTQVARHLDIGIHLQ